MRRGWRGGRLASLMLGVAMLALPGCGAPRRPVPAALTVDGPAWKLNAAVRLLEQGRDAEAGTLLEAVANEPPIPGVTDEALFQLALLRLKSEVEKDDPQTARQTLERLREEYPSSVWSAQAATLLELISARRELGRVNGGLKASNLSLKKTITELGRDTTELRMRLEQLKHLDLELEEKSRR